MRMRNLLLTWLSLCQHDGRWEGLLWFDQHQCAWEHIHSWSLLSVSECFSKASGTGGECLTWPHVLSLTPEAWTNVVWRCAVTQVADTVISKMGQVWVCVPEIQERFLELIYFLLLYSIQKEFLPKFWVLIFPGGILSSESLPALLLCFCARVWQPNQRTCCFSLSKLFRWPAAPLQITNGCQSSLNLLFIGGEIGVSM